MNHQDPTTSNGKQPEVSFAPAKITEPRNIETEQTPSRKQLTAVKQGMSSFERATIFLSILAVGMAAAAAIFICLQWHEMHTSGQDTQKLAIAAGEQANAAKSQSDQAIKQTDKMVESLKKTDNLIQATNRLAIEAKRSADAATIAAKVASEGLAFTKRTEEPLLALEESDSSDFPDGKAPGIVLTFRNYGRNPAFNVSGSITLTVDMVNGKFPPSLPSVKLNTNIIPPGAIWKTITMVANKQMLYQNKEGIKSGEISFKIRGTYTWEDATGKTFRGHDFCLVYSANPNRPPGVGPFNFCPVTQDKSN